MTSGPMNESDKTDVNDSSWAGWLARELGFGNVNEKPYDYFVFLQSLSQNSGGQHDQRPRHCRSEACSKA